MKFITVFFLIMTLAPIISLAEDFHVEVGCKMVLEGRFHQEGSRIKNIPIDAYAASSSSQNKIVSPGEVAFFALGDLFRGAGNPSIQVSLVKRGLVTNGREEKIADTYWLIIQYLNLPLQGDDHTRFKTIGPTNRIIELQMDTNRRLSAKWPDSEVRTTESGNLFNAATTRKFRHLPRQVKFVVSLIETKKVDPYVMDVRVEAQEEELVIFGEEVPESVNDMGNGVRLALEVDLTPVVDGNRIEAPKEIEILYNLFLANNSEFAYLKGGVQHIVARNRPELTQYIEHRLAEVMPNEPEVRDRLLQQAYGEKVFNFDMTGEQNDFISRLVAWLFNQDQIQAIAGREDHPLLEALRNHHLDQAY